MAPPSWTPGAAGGLTFRQFLWQLGCWAKITGMAYEDRGTALAMSLGGRAQKIAMAIPAALLGQRNGLQILVAQLEAGLGSEAQDQCKAAFETFEAYRRPGRLSATEYILTFESLYSEAVAHGLSMNRVMLSQRLLKAANLTAQQEEWILGQVGANYLDYEGIRRAMRRCPSLDGRHHGDAQMYVVDGIQHTQSADHTRAPPTYNPFNANQLQHAPPEAPVDQLPPPASLPPQMGIDSAYPVVTDDDSSDDYQSTGPSDGDPTDAIALAQAWVVHRRKRKFFKKSGGKGKSKGRKGQRKKGGVWFEDQQVFVADHERNLSNEVPDGWDKQKWLSRTPCKGCGSRWHRDCTQKRGKGQKGSGRGFSAFMTQAVLSTALLASSIAGAASYPISSASIFPCFPSSSNSTASMYPMSFVGLEEYSNREERWAYLAKQQVTRQHFGILVDTGAPQSAAGMSWITRFIACFNLHQSVRWEKCSTSIGGIGSGRAEVNWVCYLPIGTRWNPSDGSTFWKVQCLEGVGENVPPLLGLDVMKRRNGILALTHPCLELDEPDGSRYRYELHYVNGHLVLPCDKFSHAYGVNMPNSASFKADPLGLQNAWTFDNDVAFSAASGPTSHDSQPTLTSPSLVDSAGSDDRSIALNSVPAEMMQLTTASMSTPTANATSAQEERVLSHRLRPAPTADSQPPAACNPHTPLQPQSSTINKTSPPSTSEPLYIHNTATAFPLGGNNQKLLTTTANAIAHPDESMLFGVVTKLIRKIRSTTKQTRLEQNATYRKKYRGLPPTTPVPNVSDTGPQWEVWEWWAGSGRLTKMCSKLGLVCGPIISHSTGWCLKIDSHRKRLRQLLLARKPKILFGAPTCSPWSNASTNMAPDIKQMIREEEMVMLNFFFECCELQHAASRLYCYEQPRASELLRLNASITLARNTGSHDHLLCMCSHGLVDPFNGKPCKKETTIRGTVPLTRRTVKWCDCSVGHQVLQGCLPNGVLRTEVAQTYTWKFCSSLAKDFRDNLRLKMYPITEARAEGDEVIDIASEDELEPGTDDPGELARRAGMRLRQLREKRIANSSVNPNSPLPVPIYPKSELPKTPASSSKADVLETLPVVVLSDPIASFRTEITLTPVKDPSFLQQLNVAKTKERWISWIDPDIALVTHRARSLLTPNPRFSPEYFPTRSTYVFDDSYSNLSWWELEFYRNYTTLQKNEQNAILDRSFDTMVTIFHQSTGASASGSGQASSPQTPPAASTEQPQPTDKPDPAPPAVPAPEAPADEPTPPPPVLEIQKAKVVSYDETLAAESIRQHAESRLSDGTEMTIQTGPRLRMLQQQFAISKNRTILAVKIALRPAARPSPEPLVSRAAAPLALELVLQKSKTTTWTSEGWKPLEISKYAKKPHMVIIMFGKDSHPEDQAAILPDTPWGEMADDQQGEQKLPNVLQALRDGDTESRLKLILALHTRMYHRGVEEMKKLLSKAGAPLFITALVARALEGCEVCRQWQASKAKPVLKVLTASRFNVHVWIDLIFFTNTIMLICVDEAIRYCVLAITKSKENSELCRLFRREWIRHFGAPLVVFCDKESSFSSEDFATFCEQYGTERRLVKSDTAHSHFGILDRRVQLVRTMYPKLFQELTADHIEVDSYDVCAETQLAINTQLSYGGHSPYECLFGTNPRSILEDSSEFVTQNSQEGTAFWEAAYVRNAAVRQFQAALLQLGMQKALQSRARTTLVEVFNVGQWVDFYRKPRTKSLQAWRGPAVIVSVLGDGFLTVRWQSTYYDVPAHHVRPHIVTNPHASLNSSGPALLPHPSVPAIAAPPSSETAAAEAISALCTFERTFLIEGCDQLVHDCPELQTLISLVMMTPVGTQRTHAIMPKDGEFVGTPAATADGFVIYKLAREICKSLGVGSFCGVTYGAGRRMIAPISKSINIHVIWWINDKFNERNFQTFAADRSVDFTHCVDMATISQLRFIAFFEGEKDVHDNFLKTLVRDADQDEEGFQPEGRVRLGDNVSPSLVPLGQLASSQVDDSVSSRNIDDFEIDEDISETNIALLRQSQLRNNTFLNRVELPEDIITTADKEFYLVVSDLGPMFFPLNKDVGELTKAEELEHKTAVTASKLKELTSWIKLQSGKPVLISDFRQRTGLEPLPSRWVLNFKFKIGQRIIKARLVAKGFREKNQQELITKSPTATRTSHRLVKTLAASRGWPLWSIDVSAAFLRGFDFDHLNANIHARQPAAMMVDAETLSLLVTIDPVWAEAAKNPHLWCMELTHSVYGLKDAPLMWYLRFKEWLTSKAKFRPSKHDPCLFLHRADSKSTLSLPPQTMFREIGMLLSLHVDDNLITGPKDLLTWLLREMTDTFQDVSCEVDHFRHYGVDVFRNADTGEVVDSQLDYLLAIPPIDVPKGKSDEPVSAEIVTSFRSVVAGIAWVGLTFAPALTAGSFFQGYCPGVTIGQCKQVNLVLQQLKENYEPLYYRPDLCLPLRLVTLGDSSLGNASRYSQGGFYVFLCKATQEFVCGPCNQLSFKSQKSKRVASSTSHAEVLAHMSALEEASFLQSWLLELTFPDMTTTELLNAPSNLHVPIVSVGDCKDAFDMFYSPGQPTPTNRSMTLYVQAIREMFELGKVEAFVWCDTRDNAANALTKFAQSGLLELAELKLLYKHAVWEPAHSFRWHGEMLSDPQAPPLTVFAKPPPPTKDMTAKTNKPQGESTFKIEQ